MQNWPIDNEPLAWSPTEEEEPAIPLYQKDLSREMTWDTYLFRLGQRLQWMVEVELGSMEAFHQFLRTEYHVDMPVTSDQFVMSTETEWVLRERRGIHEEMFPMPVQNQPDLVEEIQRQTDPDGWMMELNWTAGGG